jgi:hypothetical protein
LIEALTTLSSLRAFRLKFVDLSDLEVDRVQARIDALRRAGAWPLLDFGRRGGAVIGNKCWRKRTNHDN